MTKVKPKRTYDSSLRKQQAGQTRLRILDAAETLFADRGYPATTVEGIAGAAGVAVDTVYAAFGSKRGVLQALLGVRVGGDEERIDLLERPGPQAVQRERDQKAQVAAFATDVSAILERARPVDDIIRGAAAVDADIAAFRSEAQAYRYRNMRKLASWLRANGPLRAGLTEDDAAAITWTMASPEVHGMLRGARGWTAERYTTWLKDSLTRILLP
ncbi:MAG TPA: helix-turn-helix domain-containing protein [Candidatus Acidoferrum sp.]|nr:helix-turn-helix domain-containing protein [Candidatus Acidoferrum sp.]